MAKIVNSWNEWDPLKRVIVGKPDGTCLGAPEPAWQFDCPKGGFPLGVYGPLPEEMAHKAQEQMDNFCKILEERDIIVERAVPLNFNQRVSTPDWFTETMHGCMPPRDVLLPVGNEILETTMSIRTRWYEYLCYRPILEEYFKEDPEFEWTAAPKPRLRDASYVKDYYHKFGHVWSKEEKKERSLARKWHLTDKEPLFDAADAIRCGKDIIWQASSVSNDPGIDWVKRHFERKGIRVHVVQFANELHPWHIDVYLMPLRPGLVVYNSESPPLSPLVEEFFKANDWEFIPAAKPCYHHSIDASLLGERRGTSWLSMNTLSLDPNTVCVEANEVRYMDQLDKLGFNVLPIPFADVIGFGGSLHCATVDVFREGDCEDYFPKQLPGF